MCRSQEMVLISKVELFSAIEEIVLKCLSQQTSPSEGVKENRPLLNREQAAEYLKISLPTLRSYTIKGVLPARYIGRKILFDPDELIAVLPTFNSLLKKRNRP